MPRTKTPTKAKKAKPVTEGSYKVSVKVLGKTFEANGSTVFEALTNLKPGICKGRSILIVEKGNVRKEKILMPMVTSRLFNTLGMTRDVALKNASLLFQGL